MRAIIAVFKKVLSTFYDSYRISPNCIDNNLYIRVFILR